MDNIYILNNFNVLQEIRFISYEYCQLILLF